MKFTTLFELKNHLEQSYGYQTFNSTAKDYKTGQSINMTLPRYIFRGEAGLYPKSLNSMQRMKSDPTINDEDKKILEHISQFVDTELRGHMHFSPLLSAAYVQHYGLFSELTDFTSNILTACKFATSDTHTGHPGLICIMDVKRAMEYTKILDLQDHPYASRPRYQHAYGIFNSYHRDMKHYSCIEDLGLTWLEFEVQDMPELQSDMDIYQVLNDQIAGYIILLLDEYVQRNGKISESAARILANRIDRVPVFAVTKDVDKINYNKFKKKGATAKEIGFDQCSFFAASANDVGCQPDLKQGKTRSIQKWSTGDHEANPSQKFHAVSKDIIIELVNYKMFKTFV